MHVKPQMMASITQVMDVRIMDDDELPVCTNPILVEWSDSDIITLLDLEDDHSDSSRRKQNDNANMAIEEKEIIFLTQLHDFSNN